MTEKLYYKDSHIKTFTAEVTSCEGGDGKYYVTLDRSAFFPGGGGQAADAGTIGTANIVDACEKDGEPVYCVDSALEAGKSYNCALDWELRFRRMQNHSGEHIISGLVNRRFGYDNTGFHMSEDHIVLDFNGELSTQDVEEIELAANMAVWENARVTAVFPTPGELERIPYRSKLDLTENVRIVTIEGYDICACCAPHVKQTGEIGLIKIVDHMKHRGGTRMTVKCGSDAYRDYADRHAAGREICALLSAKQSEAFPAVKKIYDELQKEKYQSAELKKSVLCADAERLEPSAGNICVFYPECFDINSLRSFVNEAGKRCEGIAAAFSGSDDSGYSYVMGSANVDLRQKAAEINAAIIGRGGGSREMIQGSAKAGREDIEKFFDSYIK